MADEIEAPASTVADEAAAMGAAEEVLALVALEEAAALSMAGEKLILETDSREATCVLLTGLAFN
jgi:hypothetical protein